MERWEQEKPPLSKKRKIDLLSIPFCCPKPYNNKFKQNTISPINTTSSILYKKPIEAFNIKNNDETSMISTIKPLNDSSIKDLQAQINILQMEKEANENQIKSLMKEVEDNQDLKEKYNKLNDEYNSIKIKRDCFYKENIDFQMKKKLNEKLINELQNEINNLKKENFEKFERIIVLEKNNKLNEIKLGETIEKLTKYTIENNDLAKLNIELRNNS